VRFLRYVTEFEIGPGGRLLPRPGAAWRPEPVRSEPAVHRDLAKLENASPRRIAAFASVHGLLRRQAGGLLSQSGPAMAVIAVMVGQQSVDDNEIVRAWLEAGARGDPPAGLEDAVALVAVYASLPDAMLDTIDAYLDGTATETPDSDPAVPLAAFAAVSAAIAPHVPTLVEHAGRISELDPARLRRGLRVSEWVYRVFAGLDDEPKTLAAMGGAGALLAALPAALPEALAVPSLLDGPDGPMTAYVSDLATETVADWRDAAHQIADCVATTDLIRAALTTGLTDPEARDLAKRYHRLAGFWAPAGIAPADLAERTRLLLARTIEAELQALGVWPVPRAALAGLHVRALVAAWKDLTDAEPPAPCEEAGCPNTIPATRNRRFCDGCILQRRRERTRARRLAANGIASRPHATAGSPSISRSGAR
jgi:hypothetical protein